MAKATTAVAMMLVLSSAGATSDDPAFDDGTQLLGSCRYVEGDWHWWRDHEEVIEPEMQRAGLFLNPQPAFTAIQYKQTFTPAAGKTAWAKFRMRFDHPSDITTKAGFFETEPDVSAYFLQEPDDDTPAHDGKLSLVTKKSGGSVNVEDLNVTILESEVFDLVVKVSGTTNVTFYYKKSSEANWSAEQVTDSADLPDGPMRFSAATKTGGTNGFVVLRVFEYEADR